MNTSFFIANRISKSSTGGYSGTIIKIAIATIAISVAAMILAISVLYGFKKGISEKIFGFWGHIHVTDTRISRTFELTPIKNIAEIKDSIAGIGQISRASIMDEGSYIETSQSGVKTIHPYIMMPGIIKRQRDLEGIILKGLNHEFEWSEFEQYLKRGRFPLYQQDSLSREILISEQTANRLRVDTGDILNLYFVQDKDAIKRAYKICGIYRTGLEEYDVKFAFVDLKTIQSVLQWESDQIGGYEIFIDHIEDAELIADYIYEEILPANLIAQTIQEKFGNLFQWIKLQDMNAFMLMFLMAIVAIINMCTAILILILERSKMIGTLKALGMSNWDIRKIFVYNAFWIMALAIIIGNILGIGIGLLQDRTGIMKLDETNYYLSEVPVSLDAISILVVNLITILVTIIVMLIPTLIITKISPVKILRFD